MEAYSEVLTVTSKNLKTYINETQDSISLQMIGDFLAMSLSNKELDLSGGRS